MVHSFILVVLVRARKRARKNKDVVDLLVLDIKRGPFPLT